MLSPSIPSHQDTLIPPYPACAAQASGALSTAPISSGPGPPKTTPCLQREAGIAPGRVASGWGRSHGAGEDRPQPHGGARIAQSPTLPDADRLPGQRADMPLPAYPRCTSALQEAASVGNTLVSEKPTFSVPPRADHKCSAQLPPNALNASGRADLFPSTLELSSLTVGLPSKRSVNAGAPGDNVSASLTALPSRTPPMAASLAWQPKAGGQAVHAGRLPSTLLAASPAWQTNVRRLPVDAGDPTADMAMALGCSLGELAVNAGLPGGDASVALAALRFALAHPRSYGRALLRPSPGS